MDNTNPAFRLLTILEEGRSIPQQSACKAAWSQILKTDQNSPELLIRLGKVMELPSQIVQSLQDTYPDEPNTWQHWNSQVQQAFQAQQLQSQWSTFIANIDVHSFTYLRMHAKLLQVQSKTKPLAADTLVKARAELNECLSEILESEVDIDVKRYLARNLRKLIAAIDEYHITGTSGVLDSIEIVMGHQVFDPKYRDLIQKTGIGSKISATIGTVADAMTIVLGLPQIGPTINKLLGS